LQIGEEADRVGTSTTRGKVARRGQTDGERRSCIDVDIELQRGRGVEEPVATPTWMANLPIRGAGVPGVAADGGVVAGRQTKEVAASRSRTPPTHGG
jgi:hypothetical protein